MIIDGSGDDDGGGGRYKETTENARREPGDAGVGFEEREEERKKGVTGPNGGYVAV